MAPKQKEGKSKKAVREKSAQIVSDNTFGLKNKNKSSKVQKFVKQVETAVKHSDGTAQRQGESLLKKANKLKRAAEEEELNQLLGEGLSNFTGIGTKKGEYAAKAEALGLTTVSEEVQELLAQFSSDSDEEVEIKEKRKTIYLDSDDEDDDGNNMRIYREKTIEDMIDEQRARLQAEGKAGTPITEITFNIWRKEKLEKRQKLAEERVKIEQSKKKGGKGLSVLSGRELFKYDSTLFKDDTDALNHEQEMELSNMLKLSKEAEEILEKEASEKAQKEQDRLMEAIKVEKEARRLKDEARCDEASRRERLMEVGGVIINEVVFEEDEREDLTQWSDDESESESESDDDDDDEEEGDEMDTEAKED
jgi:hypothetical protein